MTDISHFLFEKVVILVELLLTLQRFLRLLMKNSNKNLLIFLLLALIAIASCTNGKRHFASDAFNNSDGFNHADSIISEIGDTRNHQRALEVIDSFQKTGELPLVRAIFYRTISLNMLGHYRSSLHLYAKLAGIDVNSLKTGADMQSYIYANNNFIRVLCDMSRYDRALREANTVDRKLKAVGY